MASQPGNAASALPAAAHVVGNAFVNQYYNVLHQSPQVVYRFYTHASRLTHAEAGADGAVDIVSTQDDIHTIVMSSDYSEFKAEIKTVDSQDSLDGGVLVLVTGSLSTKSKGKRNFVQSFFLAPQEKGYFVLNDIFRYLDEEIQQTKPSLSLPNGVLEATPVPQPEPEPVVEQPASVQEPEVVREVATPAHEDEPTAHETEGIEEAETVGIEEEEHSGPGPVEDTPTLVIEELKSPMVQATSAPVQAVHEPDVVGEAPKLSYANILKVLGAPPKVAQPVAERPTVAFSPAPALATPPQDNQEESAPVESEADGRSVYIKNLPTTMTSLQLEEELLRFGPVKSGGVNVKNQKPGVCYAFVEFEEQSAAQSAIEASPVPIGGRQVYIEEKKLMGRAPRRLNDRSYRSDRNDRGEGTRGRGSYGGRNPGRRPGQDSRDRDGNRGGRGSGPARGGYSASYNAGASDNTGPDRRAEGQRAPRGTPGGAQPPRSNGPPAVTAA